MKNIFNEKEEAFKEREELISDFKNTLEKKQEVLEAYEKRESKIQTDIKYLDKQIEKMDKTIKSFSSFWSDDLSKVLVRLLNELDDENYVLIKKQFQNGNTKSYYNVIINEKLEDNLFDETSFKDKNSLSHYYQKSDKLIVVGEVDAGITFNYVNKYNYMYSSFFKQNIIYDFINYLINCKYNKNAYDFSLDEMNELLDRYIKNKKEKTPIKTKK